MTANELTVLTITALALVGNRLSHELANCYEEAIVYRVLVSPTCPTQRYGITQVAVTRIGYIQLRYGRSPGPEIRVKDYYDKGDTR
jgi:hypothetical protein